MLPKKDVMSEVQYQFPDLWAALHTAVRVKESGSSDAAAISASWDVHERDLLTGKIWESEDLAALYHSHYNGKEVIDLNVRMIGIVRSIGDGRIDHPGCPVWYHSDEYYMRIPAVVIKVGKRIKINGNFPGFTREFWTTENKLTHQFESLF